MAKYSLERLRPEYLKLWGEMVVTRTGPATAQALQVIANKERYKKVEKQTGVPWFVVGCLHMRESNGNFNTYLGNGQPLNRVTTIVPKGRGPWNSFEEGAYDALVTVEHLDQIKDWGPEHVAYGAEKFNGFGYRHPSRNIPSPYLWGGTSIQKPGKFVRDGVYDPGVMDQQIGAMAVLRRVMDLDPEAKFKKGPPSRPKPKGPVLSDSAKAEDVEEEVKPLTRSKTIWGGILGYITTALTALGAFFERLGDSPLTWILLIIVLVVGGFALLMIIKGRIDVQKVVEHLSEDEDAL